LTYVKHEGDLLTEISQKLDVVIGLLVARSMSDADTAAVFERLRDMSLSPKVIARVTGISENAVNIRLSRLRRKKASV
jgi:DNA-directed RNA polymerase specialized sigma24 family protein